MVLDRDHIYQPAEVFRIDKGGRGEFPELLHGVIGKLLCRLVGIDDGEAVHPDEDDGVAVLGEHLVKTLLALP